MEGKQISFDRIDVRFLHINVRTEKHGDEEITAFDCDFRYETSNDALAIFSPTLRSDLYCVDPSIERKKGGKLAGFEEALTLLKHPAIESIRWKLGDIAGGEFVIHREVSGKDMAFELANVGKFKIEPKNGGTVAILFQAQIRPKGKDRGELVNLLEIGTVNVSVIPPKPIELTSGPALDGTH